jgi:hypothetical protein
MQSSLNLESTIVEIEFLKKLKIKNKNKNDKVYINSQKQV